MKILLINASPRKKTSRTFRLAAELAGECVSRGAEVETVHLADLKLAFCRHCELCHRRMMDCPIKDDAVRLAGEMLVADAIIISTPNYINQVPGSLKTFFDRASHFIHCKRLLGKYLCAVVTSGSGYDKPVLRYLKYYAIICGAQYSGGISCRADEVEKNFLRAKKLARKLISDARNQRQYPGQIRRIKKGLEYFGRVISARRSDWKEEYGYWKKQGWLK